MNAHLVQIKTQYKHKKSSLKQFYIHSACLFLKKTLHGFSLGSIVQLQGYSRPISATNGIQVTQL